MRDEGLEKAYAYAAEMQARNATLPRYIKKSQLRQIVPLADTTIYEMEQRKDFPHRIYLTPRVVVWSLAEVEALIERRRRDSEMGKDKAAERTRCSKAQVSPRPRYLINRTARSEES